MSEPESTEGGVAGVLSGEDVHDEDDDDKQHARETCSNTTTCTL